MVAEPGSAPGSCLLFPTHQPHRQPVPDGRSQARRPPRLFLHSPPPCRHLGSAPSRSAPSHVPFRTCTHCTLSRPPRLTGALYPALTYTPLFTRTHIHHGPRQTAAERSNTSRLTSRQAQRVMDRSPPFTALAPGMMNVAPSALAFSTEKADELMTCLCGQPMSSLEAAPTGEQEAFIKHLPCARCRARHFTNTLSRSFLTTRRQEDSSSSLNG